MHRNYYCLVAGLPNISMDDSKLTYGSAEFYADLEEFIHKDDLEFFNFFKYAVDNDNLYNIMIEHSAEFIKGGVYTQLQLDEYLSEPAGIVEYMAEFIREFHDEEFDKDVNKKRLTYLYYDHISRHHNAFVREWFDTEINVKNIFAALNCRKYGLQAEKEIIKYNFVSEALLKSGSRDFGLSAEYPLVEKIIALFDENDLVKREKTNDMMKWEWLDENTFFHYFTIEKLIAYYIKLTIIERWMKLDPQTGKEFFEKFIEELRTGYDFPDEFRIVKIKNK